MAASGSVVDDLIPANKKNEKTIVRISQLSTLVIGLLSILLASTMENVLSLMLYAYAFMVYGLFVSIVAAMFLKNYIRWRPYFPCLSEERLPLG